MCRSVLVQGISKDTTKDAILLYFENKRSSGGPVEKVEFKEGEDYAVVYFTDPKSKWSLN